MANARPINNIVSANAVSVNDVSSASGRSETQVNNASVASTEYWYEQSKYYAGVSQNASNSAAQSAQMAENAKDTILTDAGFIAVKNDLANINTVAGDITNINVIAEMIINNDNLLFYEEIE